jgi:hypothetical protein
MKFAPLLPLWLSLAVSSAAAQDRAPLGDEVLAQTRAGAFGEYQALIMFPGPDVKWDFLHIDPLPFSTGGLIARFQFSSLKDECDAWNCNQAVLTLSGQVTISGLRGFR